MKRIRLFLAVIIMLTAVSCSNGTSHPSEQTPSQNYTAEKLSNITAYRKENIELPSEMRQMYTFMPYNNSTEYLLLGAGTRVPEFWHVNADFTEFELVEFPEFAVGKSYDLDAGNDGTVVTFVNHADYGDLEPIGLYEYPESYDEELYDANAEYKFMINTYSCDGSLVSSADVQGYGGIADKMSLINEVTTDGKTVIVLLSGAYEIFSTDGTYIGELTADEGDIDTIGKDKDGRLICSVAYKEEEADKLKICLINPDGTLSDYNSTVYDFEETPQGIQQGTGDYSFFLWSRSTIFGIRSDNAEIVPLFNIHASGMTSGEIDGIYITDDGNVAVISNDYSNYSVSFKKYIPRTAEEMANIPVLTMGVFGDGEIERRNFINPWNDEGHDFMLELKSYEADIDENGIAHLNNTLQEDIISGNMPDIMLTDGTVAGINLAEMGVFCDLYEFMDKDDVYTRDYFVPNVLECFETDGKLYSLTDRFCIEAGKVAKTRFVGDGSDWSFDKYADMIINPPVDIEIEYDSKERRSYFGLSSTDWVDFDTMTCHFTDDSFVKFLNWCNEAENIESVYPDWEETTIEEDEANYVIERRRYIDDREIFANFTWLRYGNYVEDTRGMFGGEEITYLETPTLTGDNYFAISANSEYKELAWEYIKSRCSDDAYKMPENGFTGPFPVTKSGLEYYENYERTHYTDYTQYDETKDDPEWKDYKGLIYQLGFSIYENALKLGEITDEDVQAVNDMIARAEPAEESNIAIGFDFYNIVDEEMNVFFNGGCTAEECAETIQSRASIYLSEQFG
ncbi:MAG: hypothetical protein NC340_08140 [Ruminococcus flavefaciens]|nr:hypothetical protein [Ruminococcus flavefaciens]MCM1229662.1 hypothetical protein [Ruminococcus flavefaciens]